MYIQNIDRTFTYFESKVARLDEKIMAKFN